MGSGAIMSISTRKIIHYSVKIENFKTNKLVNANVIKKCFSNIMKLNKSQRLYDNAALHRFHFLSYYKDKKQYGWGYFKSAKYHHRPDLIDKNSLSERQNPKKITEGEAEKTHFAYGIDNNEILLLIETKRDGVQIRTFQLYLETYLMNINKNYRVNVGLSVKGDFNQKLKEMDRVSAVEIYTPYRQVSDTFGNIPIAKGDIRDDAIVTFKAKRSHSIRNTAKSFYQIFTNTERDDVARLRVYGKTVNESSILLDTNRLKDHDTIRIELDDNGQVITNSILPALKELVKEIL